jgi:hypothetical protein
LAHLELRCCGDVILLRKIPFFCLLAVCSLFAGEQLCEKETLLLKPTLRLMLEQTEMGYVLLGKKPICTINYLEEPIFFDEIEPLEQLALAVYALKDILRNFYSKNIIFHFDEKEKLLLVINKKNFFETVKDNLALFQYVLGPTITPALLLSDILSLQTSFCETLRFDRVLIGLILGYGLQNSLFESRLQSIEYDYLYTKDIPPYLSQASARPENKEAFLFLDHEEGLSWKTKSSMLPTSGFYSLDEEKKFLKNKMQIASQRLVDQAPPFIFSCLKVDQHFLNDLETVQAHIQQLLSSSSWFKEALTLISGEEIIAEDSASSVEFFVTQYDINAILAKFLKNELKEREAKYHPFFYEGFIQEDDDVGAGGDYTAAASAIKNLSRARRNLEETDRFFYELAKNDDFKVICEPYLYYTILEQGYGATLKNAVDVCVDFKIYDPFGNCLNSGTKVRLNLRKAIPGFAHGMQEMMVGEKRALYIHPALAYGVHTFLEKGIFLKAVVTLNEIYDSHATLPELRALDLAFVKNDVFFLQCEEEHKQALRFIGWNKRRFLQRCPNLDVKAIAEKFNSLELCEPLSQEESKVLNAFFLNYYFASSFLTAMK